MKIYRSSNYSNYTNCIDEFVGYKPCGSNAMMMPVSTAMNSCAGGCGQYHAEPFYANQDFFEEIARRAQFDNIRRENEAACCRICNSDPCKCKCKKCHCDPCSCYK